MEKAKISPRQMTNMLIITIIGTAILVAPGAVTEVARQDSWLTFIVAALFNLVTATIIIALGRIFPGQTMISYFVDLLGKYPGKILSILYIFFFIRTNFIIVREYSEFLNTTVLTATPMEVLMVIVILLSCYAVYYGIEVIGRLSEIIVPWVVLSFFIVVILIASQADIGKLMPFGEGGLVPIIKGAIIPNAYTGEIFLMGVLLPYLNRPSEIKKIAVLSIVTVAVLLIISTVASVSLFGISMTSSLKYPAYELFREIDIPLIDRLEVLGMILWVAGGFLKIAVFQYISVASIAQWLELKDYRPLIPSLGLVIYLLGIIYIDNIIRLGIETSKFFPLLAPVFETIIPAVLLATAFFKINLKFK